MADDRIGSTPGSTPGGVLEPGTGGTEIVPGASVAVIGAGTMGRGIAQTALAAGCPVLLHDTDSAGLEAAVAEIRTRLDAQRRRGRLTLGQHEAALAGLTPVPVLKELRGRGVVAVIEAVVEDLAVKRQLLAELEALLDADCLLATNTSALSVGALATALREPARLVGMHFFNPAPAMRLVEIVSAEDTDRRAAERAAVLAAAWGKTPVHCADTPGFVVNRINRAYYAEALGALDQRVAEPEVIDALLTDCGGFRMGPFALMDLIGLDVNSAAGRAVWEAFGQDPRFAPSHLLRRKVEAGHLGRKTGRGWYRYSAEGRAEIPEVRGEPAGPRPESVIAYGSVNGLLGGLVERCAAAGIEVRFEDDDSENNLELPDGTQLVFGDSSPATDNPEDYELNLVMVDLALDYRTASRIAIAVSEHACPGTREAAAGFFQALGMTVHVVRDVPGLVVTRTVAMLVSLAVEAVATGAASPADVDTALRLGANHPIGPLEWGDRLGAPLLVDLLEELHRAWPTGRYAPSPWLRRRAFTGRGLRGE